MPKNSKVILEYGPYEACGVVKHRTSRLEGLETVLTSEGHSVALSEIEDWNLVRLKVNGEIVFTCNICELDYGGDGKLDELCSQASKQVLSAY
uniref:UPF0728 protein-like n=1 Tax=Ciona intestinalis TaxID=7719 RepID=UPI000180CDB9|nr:UPF0728 protein-like [Ciona intestinalis]|eukprot:XP_002121244.1 UPF0728 protein-like [Ciona intestinalis]